VKATTREEHFHEFGTGIDPDDVTCRGGGDTECPLWNQQLEEAMEVWQ
jgi:hypothetical protein